MLLNPAHIKSLIHFNSDFSDETGKVWTPARFASSGLPYTYPIALPNILRGGTASADSSYSGYPASKANDGSFSGAWSSQDTGFPHWWRCQVATPVKVSALTLQTLWAGSIKDFILQGLNDNATWDDLYTGVGANTTDSQTFNFSLTSLAYSDFRLYITSNYRGNSYCDIVEIGLSALDPEVDISSGPIIDFGTSVFGGSAYFPGNAVIHTPSSSDFDLNADWTIALRTRPLNLPPPAMYALFATESFQYAGLSIEMDTVGHYKLWMSSNAASWNVASNLTIGTAAMTSLDVVMVGKSGNTIYYFFNGTLVGTIDVTGITLPISRGNPSLGGSYLPVGAFGEYFIFQGWIDEFLFYGQALHTESYPPETEEYTMAANYAESINESLLLMDVASYPAVIIPSAIIPPETRREGAQWRRGKTPIVVKYSAEHAKMMAEIAGRGFLRLPGYAYDIENGIELSAKMLLSELNLKILTETIERELKQTGIDYDLTYKTTLLQWEIDKQALLNAWEVEYSGIKRTSAQEEELLNQLEIAVKTRGTYLIEQKTIIELEAEALKTQIATLDGTTAPYEVQLANEKLLTAQKKLEIMPILQAIVAKEQELLIAEQGKAAAYTTLMAAEQEVVIKKETLVPVIAELTDVSEQYTGEFARQITLEGQIADEKVAQAGISKDNAAERNRTAEKEIEQANILLEVDDKKKELSDVKNTNEAALLNKDIANIHSLENAETGANKAVLDDEKEKQTYVLDKKRTTINYDNATKVASSGRLSGSEEGKIYSIALSEADEIKRKAEIDAVSKITAQLKHIIG